MSEATKRVLVTGGARGLGATVAEMFGAKGASLILVDTLDRELSATAKRLGATAVRMDVCDESAWARLGSDLVEDGLGLHALVSAAGIFHRAPLIDTELAEFRRVLDVNTVGAFLAVEACVPALSQGSPASVVLVSSMIALGSIPERAAYVASKWGVRGLARSAALELAPSGIRVMSVHPGLMETEMLFSSGRTSDEIVADNATRLPIRRLATPREIADAILWMTSPAASYMTGTEVVLDGGWSAS